MKHRRHPRAWAWLACGCAGVSTLGAAGTARADFEYADPAGVTQAFEIKVGDSELPMDSWNGLTDGWTSRYAPNLHNEWHIFANPYFGAAQLVFSPFDLNTFEIEGEDFVSLRWDGFPEEHRLTGVRDATPVPMPYTEPRDMMDPGIAMTFHSSPTWASWRDPSEWMETEGEGFSLQTLEAVPHFDSVDPSDPPPVVQPYWNIVGLLMQDQDALEFEIAADAAKHPVRINVWTQSGEYADVQLYGRCDDRPSPGAFGQYAALSSMLNPDGSEDTVAAWIELDPKDCASGRMFVAVQNLDPTQQVIRMSVLPVGERFADQRVGVSWDATPEQLAQIEALVRRATTAFYGATEGSVIIEDWVIYNDAHECDNGAGNDTFACGGGKCRLCFAERRRGDSSYNMRARTGFDGFVTINRPDCDTEPCPRADWRIPTEWWTLAHEFGHSYLQHGDEYHSGADDSCGFGKKITTCGASMMGKTSDQIRGFCTAVNHRTQLPNWQEMLTLAFGDSPLMTNGIDAVDCSDGHHTGAQSMWEYLNDRYSLDFPVHTHTPSNMTYRQLLGAPDAMGLWH